MRLILSIAASLLTMLALAAPAYADPAPPTSASAAAHPHADPKGAEKDDDEPDATVHHPVKYEVGINVQKLTKLELGPGTFEADFILSYHCSGPPCTPHIHLYNGDIKGKPDKIVDEPLHKVFRVKAELTTEVDVSDFPFDAHELQIDLGDGDEDDVTMVANAKDAPDPTDVKIPGWDVIGGVAAVEVEDVGEGIKVSHYVYTVTVKRPSLAAFAKNFLPAFTMCFVLFISLFMKPKMAAARLAAGTGSFVAVIMFHNTASAQLPPLSFFTRLDKFMFTLYFLWLVHIAFSIMILRADEQKNEKRGEALYKAAWIAVPLIAITEWALVFTKVL